MSKVAVIGVGGWGKNHARVLNELQALSVICDKDAVLAKEAAKKYGVNSYSNIEEMLEKESELDACMVCTPIKTHYEITKMLIDKGMHVFVEKPLSFSSEECEKMMKQALEKNVVLTAGYIERFNPAVQYAKRLIDEKKYGDLFMMEFHRENRMPAQSLDVGIIYDITVHDIDAAMFLFGSRPEVVFARAGKKLHPYEDFATIMLGFSNQRVAVIASNWLTPNKIRTFSAVCTDGIITGNYILQEVKIDHGEATIFPRIELKEPLMLELSHFLDVIAGRRKEPLVSAADATYVTRIAEAAILSNQTGKPISLK
ncbi:Gfo/Idh/MocA family oxidoreductase [Nitrososphaera sp.]|uniref:Gfo/Idh/MocA family protein n=1 Tax=Nitrososphaera sp. TaxID=1971748 RepID=UPI00181B0B86|nr:Gfo/Idh/MocA family oxidoreductase [Nitrososphaera sp.]NWG36476.1 Gfo/Idh/MocA family oxidoreductase [Nitrososphaera sp.]